MWGQCPRPHSPEQTDRAGNRSPPRTEIQTENAMRSAHGKRPVRAASCCVATAAQRLPNTRPRPDATPPFLHSTAWIDGNITCTTDAHGLGCMTTPGTTHRQARTQASRQYGNWHITLSNQQIEIHYTALHPRAGRIGCIDQCIPLLAWGPTHCAKLGTSTFGYILTPDTHRRPGGRSVIFTHRLQPAVIPGHRGAQTAV